MKSSVELYWQRIAEKAGDTRTWNDLTPQQQHIVINSINALLFVLGDNNATAV